MNEAISILLIDDETKLVERLSKVLQAKEYIVDSATNGRDGIEKIRNGQFDILITDLNMPELSGFDVMEYVSANHPDTLIMALTGNASVEGAIKAIKFGAYDFIEKPVTAASLDLILKRATEHIKLTRENRNNLEELKKLNELKNEFLAVVSHDIRSPLSSIGGYANYLLKKGKIDDLSRRYLLIIKDISEHLYSLVNEILDISKIETGIMSINKEMTDIESVVSSSINSFILLAIDKNNTLDVVNDMKERDGELDKMKFTQVMNNLVSNAIKFTENGKIIITLSDTDSDKIKIEVSDTGIGMNEEEISKLFSQYAYANKRGTRGETGNGLGLVICKKFIDLHNGEISVTSRPSEGTIFTIVLPRR